MVFPPWKIRKIINWIQGVFFKFLHHVFRTDFWELNTFEQEIGECLLEEIEFECLKFEKGLKQVKTYTKIWNADGDWIQNDVKESNETSDPEGEDEENDQPNDEPKCFCHCLTRILKG